MRKMLTNLCFTIGLLFSLSSPIFGEVFWADYNFSKYADKLIVYNVVTGYDVETEITIKFPKGYKNFHLLPNEYKDVTINGMRLDKAYLNGKDILKKVKRFNGSVDEKFLGRHYLFDISGGGVLRFEMGHWLKSEENTELDTPIRFRLGYVDTIHPVYILVRRIPKKIYQPNEAKITHLVKMETTDLDLGKVIPGGKLSTTSAGMGCVKQGKPAKLIINSSSRTKVKVKYNNEDVNAAQEEFQDGDKTNGKANFINLNLKSSNGNTLIARIMAPTLRSHDITEEWSIRTYDINAWCQTSQSTKVGLYQGHFTVRTEYLNTLQTPDDTHDDNPNPGE